MLRLKLQHSGHLMWRTDSMEKTLMLGKIEGRRRRERQDEMVGWHYRLKGHESEQAPGVVDGQGSLACCSPWGRKELNMTERLNWTELMSIESVMTSNHVILCCFLLLLPLIFPCIRVFSNEWVLHIRWPKYWSFSFCIRPSNEYSGLISFRIDWFDLFVAQETLQSLLQHHSSKA